MLNSRLPARRDGQLALVLSIAGLTGLATVVLAVSGQARGSRTTQAQVWYGRCATEMAESAIAECAGDLKVGRFSELLAATSSALSSLPGGRATAGPGQPLALSVYEPELTRGVIEQVKLPVTVSAVGIQLLWYSPDQERGEVELSCSATYTGPDGRPARRRVTILHPYVSGPEREDPDIDTVPSEILKEREV